MGDCDPYLDYAGIEEIEKALRKCRNFVTAIGVMIVGSSFKYKSLLQAWVFQQSLCP